jgi:dTDP-4-dehydrorhamnose 3,5-epimerase
MIFRDTGIPGSFVIELEPRADARGSFARAFCRREFAAAGLTTEIAQINTSFNHARATLRGMHYQLPPHAETKVVRCVRGAIFDVVLDVRPGSATFGQSYGTELSAENGRMMYVPKGFAHGYLTLADASEVFYLVDEFYAPDRERGIRWDDPRFAIRWPFEPTLVSDKDAAFPVFDPAWHLDQR